MAIQKAQNQGFPQISSPIVNESGNATLPWYQFFISLWNRTGGTQGQTGPYVPSDVAITGGTIDGTVIGKTTPANGTFSDLQATKTITASNFTGSSSGANTGDVTLAGQNYLSIFGQNITVNPINLSGSNVTNELAAANFPALTGDITTLGGSLATTLATVNSNVGNFASVTVNGKGLVTAAHALTGDITSSGSATTLAMVNSSPGTYANATLTVNAKGLITAASTTATGISTTIVTAQLTPTGTQGSMTFVSGLLTASTPAT